MKRRALERDAAAAKASHDEADPGQEHQDEGDGQTSLAGDPADKAADTERHRQFFVCTCVRLLFPSLSPSLSPSLPPSLPFSLSQAAIIDTSFLDTLNRERHILEGLDLRHTRRGPLELAEMLTNVGDDVADLDLQAALVAGDRKVPKPRVWRSKRIQPHHVTSLRVRFRPQDFGVRG